MPKARTYLGQFSPLPIFTSFGFLFAIISIFAGIGFSAFFKSFLVSMIILLLGYSILAAWHKLSAPSLLGLLMVGIVIFLTFQSMPNLLPLSFVPMAFFGVPSPGVSSGSIAVPDAIWMLFTAFILGMIFTVQQLLHKPDRMPPIPITILSTAMVLYAVASILSGLFFGQWGEWMILLTPLSGLQYLGLAFSAVYILLAYALFRESKAAMWLYLMFQFVAVAEAIMLGLWLSLIINISIIAYLLFARDKFTHKLPVPKNPL